MSYLRGTFSPSSRWLILGAAVVLLPVFFIPVLPIWTMNLWAPQYPEGLKLVIYSHTLKGDLQKINTLNHYVGMKAIQPDDFKEFSYLPLALTLFGVMALMAALANRRAPALVGWLAFSVFAFLMFRDYASWLYHYGHDLDPRAALKLPAFTPPVIGFAKMANFRVLSMPGAGSWLLLAAWALGPVGAVMDFLDARRRARRAAPGPAAASAA